MSDLDLVLRALARAVPKGGWAHAHLKRKTGLSGPATTAAIRAGRYAGRIEFTTLALTPGEAERQAAAIAAEKAAERERMKVAAIAPAPPSVAPRAWLVELNGLLGGDPCDVATWPTVERNGKRLVPRSHIEPLVIEMEAWFARTRITHRAFAAKSGHASDACSNILNSPHSSVGPARAAGFATVLRDHPDGWSGAAREPAVPAPTPQMAGCPPPSPPPPPPAPAGRVHPARPSDLVEGAVFGDARDAIAEVRSRWPGLWARVVAIGAGEGRRAGVVLADALGAGLDRLEEGA